MATNKKEYRVYVEGNVIVGGRALYKIYKTKKATEAFLKITRKYDPAKVGVFHLEVKTY